MNNEELWKKIEHGIDNLTPKWQLHFEVHIVEHCNLNCNRCIHFCPLAEEEYLDVNSFKNDCDQLSKLLNGEIESIHLMGGEPLLHPQVTEFMRIAREAFPTGVIKLQTNGLLLPSMPEDFWDACRTYDVIVWPTCYPVKVDYEGLKKVADSKGVKYWLSSKHEVHKKRYPISFDRLTASPFSNFFNCDFPRMCTALKDGKLYPCAIAAHVPLLVKYFNLDADLSERGGVDIYSVKSGDELLEKLARPVMFCRHCDVTDECISSEWEHSKKDRYEWLAFDFTEDDYQYLRSNKTVVYVFGAGEWGERTVTLLKNEGIAIKSVLCTRKKEGIDNILDVPIVLLDEIGEVEPNSICLVALGKASQKSEVYPLLSKIRFGDVVPIGSIY